MTFTAFIFLSLALVIQVSGNPIKITPSLEKSLSANGKADIFLTFTSPRSLISGFKSAKFASRDERLNTIGNSLKRFAKVSQADTLEFLSHVKPMTSQDLLVKSLWITNQIYVRGADAALVHKLAERSEILEIREEKKGNKLLPITRKPAAPPKAKAELEWGLKRTDVQKAWDAGFNGTGIVVAIMDSGVRRSHEALAGSYRGAYGWFSPLLQTSEPEDDDGHGTHCMGTICGQGGIGVAPGAKWMACQNIPGNEYEDIACGEFMLCPHDPRGNNPDCTKAPHVVSNSWGYAGGGDPFMDIVFAAWEVAGIVPVFAAGNEGPSCTSLRSPGDSPQPSVITVGATDSDDLIAGFSSFGPSEFDQVKPNIAAPGVEIRSAYALSDNSYAVLSGTSMASPHTAGVVALVRQAFPDASVQEIAQRLYKAVSNSIAETGRNCGGISEDTYPNNQVGHGLLSALAVLSK